MPVRGDEVACLLFSRMCGKCLPYYACEVEVVAASVEAAVLFSRGVLSLRSFAGFGIFLLVGACDGFYQRLALSSFTELCML